MAAAGLKWIATDEDILSRSLKMPMRPGAAVPPVSRRRARPGRVVPRSRDVRSHRLSLPVVGRGRCGGRFRRARPCRGPAVRGRRRRGSRDGPGHPRRRERLGVLRRRRPAVPARALPRPVGGRRHRDGHDVRSGSGPGGAAAVDLPRLLDQRRLLHLDRPSRRPSRVGSAVGCPRGVRSSAPTRSRPTARDRALEELLIAEGSDWFWWYGDDHSSDHDADFDDLFRRHLRNAYAALGAPIPEELFATNISTGAGPDRLEPSGLLTVTLDGKDTSFLEWVGAVTPALARPGGAMHEVAASPLDLPTSGLACPPTALCLRLAGSELAALIGVWRRVAGPGPRRRRGPRPADRAIAGMGVGTIVEVQIPFDRIGVAPARILQFAIQVRDRSDADSRVGSARPSLDDRGAAARLVTSDWQA